jgi:hypothetical protein
VRSEQHNHGEGGRSAIGIKPVTGVAFEAEQTVGSPIREFHVGPSMRPDIRLHRATPPLICVPLTVWALGRDTSPDLDQRRALKPGLINVHYVGFDPGDRIRICRRYVMSSGCRPLIQNLGFPKNLVFHVRTERSWSHQVHFSTQCIFELVFYPYQR